jgi:hypothetical protein
MEFGDARIRSQLLSPVYIAHDYSQPNREKGRSFPKMISLGLYCVQRFHMKAACLKFCARLEEFCANAKISVADLAAPRSLGRLRNANQPIRFGYFVTAVA